MIIFLYGFDIFRAREKFNELKKKFLEKNNGKEYLVSTISSDDFNIADFRNKVLSSGFFAEKKMIALKCGMRNAECRIKDNEKEILEIIKKIREETILIVWDKSDDEKLLKSELGKYLLGQKYVFKFNPLSGNALVSWIRERTKNYGCEIDNEAVAEICDILGNDLWKIDLELGKLCAYAAPHFITKKIVGEMLACEAEENIFKFIDALAAKNKRLALLSLEEEFAAGAAELQILGAIARQIRILLQIKASGVMQKDAIAKHLGIHPYVAQKSFQQVKNFQPNELKNIYRQLLAVDISIKTGGASAKAMFGRMIAKI